MAKKQVNAKKKVKKDIKYEAIAEAQAGELVDTLSGMKKKDVVANPKFSESERLFLDNAKAIEVIKKTVIALEQRINRIVAAIDKSKSVRNL